MCHSAVPELTLRQRVLAGAEEAEEGEAEEGEAAAGVGAALAFSAARWVIQLETARPLVCSRATLHS